MTLLTLLRTDDTARPPDPSPSIRVRERMPLATHVTGVTPNGRDFRWDRNDDDPANRPSSMRWSDTMPGGFDRFGCTLPRKPGVDYGDLAPLSTLTVRDYAGGTVWEGRLERAPRSSGDQMSVSPDAVGWQAHLEDDRSSVSMVYRDVDLSRWQGPSAQRRAALIAASLPQQSDATAAWDESTPSLVLSVQGTWTSPRPLCETWYDAGDGNRIGRIYFEWSGWPDTTFLAFCEVAADGARTVAEQAGGGDFYTAPTGTMSFTPTNRFRYALVNWFYGATGGDGGATYDLRLRHLAVYGDHTVPVQGAEPDAGLLASDIVADAVGRWAPLLRFTTGVGGTIQPTTFPIPQAAYDRSTVLAILQDVTKYEQPEWAVWDDRTLYMNPPGTRGRRWKARVGPSGLEETGPQVDRMWNGVIVQYQDVDGSTKTAGPPGSGCDTESALLLDSDPENPANKLNIRRWDMLQMGIVSTPAAAVQAGSRFLAESRVLSTAGQARFVGYVTDESGVEWPYHHVRAGDTVEFVDSSDPSPRRIVQADKDDASRSCQVTLDSPPDSLGPYLARRGVVLVPLGL